VSSVAPTSGEGAAAGAMPDQHSEAAPAAPVEQRSGSDEVSASPDGETMSSEPGAPEAAPTSSAFPPPTSAVEDRHAAFRNSTGGPPVDGVALARLYGEPLFRMPTDLYIPPDALEVFLETFEGPLDLLLYLIRRQNFNIFDIPLAQVTRQYLDYVEQIRKHNLELASEYLLMAAMLIEIKSRMLLPPKPTADGAEPEDPRAELVRRLLEYEQMKLAAAQLDALPVIGRDFLRAQVTMEQSNETRFPDVDLADLRDAWADILKRAKLNQHHHISREQLSVREYMTKMLRRLQGVRYVEFQDLFDAAFTPTVMVVTFIAMLELSREHLLEVTQAEAFAPIYVRLAYAQQE
jgi:segregation and condensation protein A